MRRLLIVLLTFLGTLPALRAQISVSVAFKRTQYLPYEHLEALVRITNFSGRTLKLGADPNWLSVDVTRDDGQLVPKNGNPPVVEPFVLPSASRAIRRVVLVPYFDMGAPGRYEVVATVRIKQLGEVLTSPPSAVVIISSTPIWRQRFGLPPDWKGKGHPGDVREYALLQDSRDNGLRLYVRVSDQYETKVYAIYPLGQLLTFSRPEARVDREGNLHVLFQVGARSFNYSIVHPDGKLAVRQTYAYTNTRPELWSTPDGAVRVRGGVRQRNDRDLPVPGPLPANLNDPPTANPPALAKPAATPKPKGTPPASPDKP